MWQRLAVLCACGAIVVEGLACRVTGGRSDGDAEVDGDSDGDSDGDGDADGDADADTDGDSDGDGDADGDGGADSDSDADCDAPARDSVLAFHGRGGYSIEGEYGFGAFTEVLARYQAAGLVVRDLDEWPSQGLEQERLVFLAVPGWADAAARFSADEVADMDAMVRDGGTLVVINDWSGWDGTATINDLLERLGVSFTTAVDSIPEGTTDELGSEALVAGLTALQFTYASRIDGAASCLASTSGSCILAQEELGGGLVVLATDTSLVDDYGLIEFGGAADNDRLVDRLAGIE